MFAPLASPLQLSYSGRGLRGPLSRVVDGDHPHRPVVMELGAVASRAGFCTQRCDLLVYDFWHLFAVTKGPTARVRGGHCRTDVSCERVSHTGAPHGLHFKRACLLLVF